MPRIRGAFYYLRGAADDDSRAAPFVPGRLVNLLQSGVVDLSRLKGQLHGCQIGLVAVGRDLHARAHAGREVRDEAVGGVQRAVAS